MKWTDIYDIAASLEEEHPNQDVFAIRFTDLRKFILALPDFVDNPTHCNEKILEAVQAAWIKERE